MGSEYQCRRRCVDKRGVLTQRDQDILSQLRGTDLRSINELFRQTGAGGIPNFGAIGSSRGAPQTPARDVSGAAAAAGVLTAIDEDNEGDEEAPVPGEFDYYTDAEDDE